MISRTQIKTIHVLLPFEIKADKEEKANLIAQFTEDENKTSTKDLTLIQANNLIHFLRTGEIFGNAEYAYFDKYNLQHRYLLSLAIQLGWHRQKGSKTIADLERLGAWFKKNGYLHKPLMDYNPAELSKLVHQFELVVSATFRQ